jgi:L-alanine-DL-glutamate epimerase-like enolase superfamily enzyme
MFYQRDGLSRRSMFWRAAAASGLGAILKMTEGPVGAQEAAGQPAGRGGAPAAGRGAGQGRGGGGGMGGFGGGRGAPVHYGPINKYSSPSDLRITDMRAVTVAANYDYNMIRLDTNQGVYGLGEVRDAGSKVTALMLKPYVVGASPLDITNILRRIRHFSWHGRQGGGYSAVDLALHDIVGKVYGVPVYRLLGDKKRDRVRMYCDTTEAKDPKIYAQRMLDRRKAGFTFFKMDLRTQEMVGDVPGAVDTRGVATDKGMKLLCEYIAAVRDVIGYEPPLAADHFGNLDLEDSIRYARAFEPYHLAWAEDILQVNTLNTGDAPLNWHAYKRIKESTVTPLAMGESLFGLEEGFKPFLDNDAISIIHPDPGTSGQCRETKRIGDYANEHGVPVALHMAGSPLGTMGGVHIACTLDSFLAMECHAVDFMSWWQELVTGVPKPFIKDGYITVPDTPGLGIELNEPVIKEHLRYPGYFEPTTDWDKVTVMPPGAFGGRGWPHFNQFGQWVIDESDR